jgi:hypothetical protein
MEKSSLEKENKCLQEVGLKSVIGTAKDVNFASAHVHKR